MKNTNYCYKKETNIDDLFETRRAFRNDLTAAVNGELSPEIMKAGSIELCGEALNYGVPGMLFLPLTDNKGMPADARVDLIYYPTYMGTAYIINAVLKCPELLENELVANALPKLMKGCCGREFSGHGYGAAAGTLDAMEIFAEANALLFIGKHPDISPEFAKLFRKTMKALITGIHGRGSAFETFSDKERERAKAVKEKLLSF